jgi:hypothetical protein
MWFHRLVYKYVPIYMAHPHGHICLAKHAKPCHGRGGTKKRRAAGVVQLVRAHFSHVGSPFSFPTGGPTQGNMVPCFGSTPLTTQASFIITGKSEKQPIRRGRSAASAGVEGADHVQGPLALFQSAHEEEEEEGSGFNFLEEEIDDDGEVSEGGSVGGASAATPAPTPAPTEPPQAASPGTVAGDDAPSHEGGCAGKWKQWIVKDTGR